MPRTLRGPAPPDRLERVLLPAPKGAFFDSLWSIARSIVESTDRATCNFQCPARS